MSARSIVAPVEKTVTVDCSVEHAFEVFTARIGEWWPLHRYSITADEDGAGAPETVVMEPAVDGRIFERTPTGEEFDWGKVLVWEPPHRVMLEWRPSRTPTPSTELDIRFSLEGERTRVDLEHRGWERLGPRAADARAGYDSGWPSVIQAFAEAVST